MFPHLQQLVPDSNDIAEDVLDALLQLLKLNVLSWNKNPV